VFLSGSMPLRGPSLIESCTSTMDRVRTIKRIALAASAVVVGLLYVWFAAVRAAPLVRRRKAMQRARHR
jgi:hypothetical protein